MIAGRAGVPMEVMGLMLGQFVDDYTITCVDVFAMPQVWKLVRETIKAIFLSLQSMTTNNVAYYLNIAWNWCECGGRRSCISDEYA